MTTKDFNRYLSLIASGDGCGMEEIYNCFHDKLKFTAFLEVNDKATAEDIASNVLLSIFKNAANYGYIKNPNAWLYSAVKYAIFNFKKREAKYVYTEFMDEIYPAKDDKLELRIDLKQFLDTLPKRRQEIIQLHYLYGLTIKQTAKLLKISVSTVNRELVSLKDKLEIFRNF